MPFLILYYLSCFIHSMHSIDIIEKACKRYDCETKELIDW